MPLTPSGSPPTVTLEDLNAEFASVSDYDNLTNKPNIPDLGPLVIAGIGQSNMAGSNAAAATGGDLSSLAGVNIFNTNTRIFELWEPATKPTYYNNFGVDNAPAGRNLILFQMAKAAKRETGRDVYVILDAHPGDAIDQWVNGAGATVLNYNSFKSLCTSALSRVQLDGAKIEQVVISQGESDGAGVSTYAARNAYATALKIWIESIAADDAIVEEDVRFAVLQLIYNTSGAEISFSLRNDVIENLDFYGIGAATSMVRTSDLVALQSGDHWNGEAADEIGKRAFEVSKVAVAADATPRRGQVNQLAVVDDVSTSGFEIGATVGGSPYFAPMVLGGEPDFTNWAYFQEGTEIWRFPTFSAEEFYIAGLKRAGATGAYKFPSYTTAQLQDIGNAINTGADKELGATVYNSTNSCLVTSIGANANSPWRGVSGTTGNAVSIVPV